jgi:hypothetical protein
MQIASWQLADKEEILFLLFAEEGKLRKMLPTAC